MALFEMLGGNHRDKDGNTHSRVENGKTIIESDKPLDKLFKNSFRKLDNQEQKRARVREVLTKAPGGDEDEDMAVDMSQNRKAKAAQHTGPVEPEEDGDDLPEPELDEEEEGDSDLEEDEDLPEKGERTTQPEVAAADVKKKKKSKKKKS